MTGQILPELGWHILTVLYFTTLILQLTFYYLTTNFEIGLTVVSFIINFILWILEQVGLYNALHESWLYQNLSVGPILLGGLLWASNKMLIDYVFTRNRKIKIGLSRLGKLILK